MGEALPERLPIPKAPRRSGFAFCHPSSTKLGSCQSEEVSTDSQVKSFFFKKKKKKPGARSTPCQPKDACPWEERGRPALTGPKQPKLPKTEVQEKKGSKVPSSGLRKTETSLKEDAGIEEESKTVYTHWLMKSEPESRFQKGVDMKFGIEDLKAQPNQTAYWDGVRNYQARNFLRDMKVGEDAFFYHSNCKEPGIAGIIKIVKEAYPDHTQFEKSNPHYDASSTKEDPKWSMVDVQFVRMTQRFIPLAELKAHRQAHQKSGGPLKEMALFTRPRLSIQPVTDEEFQFILSLEKGTRKTPEN